MPKVPWMIQSGDWYLPLIPLKDIKESERVTGDHQSRPEQAASTAWGWRPDGPVCACATGSSKCTGHRVRQHELSGVPYNHELNFFSLRLLLSSDSVARGKGCLTIVKTSSQAEMCKQYCLHEQG